MSSRVKHFYEFGPFRLDAAERVLLLRGRELVPLTPEAFETLLALVENSGHIMGKDELLKKIWPDTFVEEATLAQNVFTLRKALGNGQQNGHQYIETVPRRGYRFVADVREITGEDATATADAGGEVPVVQPGRPKLAAVLIALAVLAVAVGVVFAIFKFVVRRETLMPPPPPAAAAPFQSMKVTRLPIARHSNDRRRPHQRFQIASLTTNSAKAPPSSL